MEQDVEQTVAEGVIAPELVFDPERGMEKRIVLLGGGWFGPDFHQTVESTKVRLGDVSIVVPQKPTGERGPESQERGGKKREHEPVFATKRRGNRGDRTAHSDGEWERAGAARFDK